MHSQTRFPIVVHQNSQVKGDGTENNPRGNRARHLPAHRLPAHGVPVRRFWIHRLPGTVALAVILLVAVGCQQPITSDPNRLHLELSPSSFLQTISLQQNVQVEQGGQTVDFDAVLEVSPTAVTLVGLAYNQRVFTLRYDGRKLEETRSRMLPRAVQAADVLSDLQLALWPAEAVRAALPAGWKLSDSTGHRELAENDSVRTSITFDSIPRWAGTITLHNRQYNYRLVIRSAVAQ